MIVDFACKDTKKVFQGLYTKKWNAEIRKKGQVKLDMIDASISLNDLRVPPGNRLHPLTDDLVGYHSISINMQWRIIFKWNDGNASEVKITNYHK
jgi:proteic killer suppression protein